jgi:hypothetical protein
MEEVTEAGRSYRKFKRMFAEVVAEWLHVFSQNSGLERNGLAEYKPGEVNGL